MDAGWSALQEDFQRYCNECGQDWDRLEQYKASAEAVERLQALSPAPFPFAASTPPGLYHLSAVIQDMDSPEFFSAFTTPPTASYKYGHQPTPSTPLDGHLISRAVYRCLPVPGSTSLSPALTTVKVMMYEGEEVKVQERLEALGMWDGEEFHVIRKRRRETGSVRAEDREEVLRALDNALGGDHLSACYVLVCLLSVVERKETLIGKVCVNLTSLQSSAPLSATLQQLSSAVEIPVTLHFLNHCKLTPTKNYEAEVIDPSPVQVCDGTVVIMDETGMEPGALTETGIENMQVLTTLINSQEVRYDFTYHVLSVNVNAPCLILSKSASLLPKDIHLPVAMTRPAAFTPVAESAKTYIENARKVAVDISDSLQSEITSAFVERRKAANVGAEDLHRWLSVARLITRSWGRTEMTKEDWDTALEWERQRLSRLETRSN